MKCLFVLFSFCSLFASAQLVSFSFEHLSIEEGLSQTQVYDVIKDRSGYVWVATQHGLNRYDGYKVKQYLADKDDPNSIPNRNILQLLIDNDGVLWLATGYGLAKYNPEKDNFTCYLPDKSKPNSIKSPRLMAIEELDESTLLIGTSTGLITMNKKAESFADFATDDTELDKLIQSKPIRYILRDSKDRVWVSMAASGIVLLDKGKATFKRQYGYDKGESTYHLSEVFNIHEDEQGRIWIGSFVGGLAEYIEPADSFKFYLNPNHTPADFRNGVLSIENFDDKTLIVGTNGGGLYLFDAETKTFKSRTLAKPNERAKLTDNFIFSIFKDDHGILWLGTENKGVEIINPALLKFASLGPSEGLSTGLINSVYTDSLKQVWIGTENNGIYVYMPNTGVVTQLNIPNSRTNGTAYFVKSLSRYDNNHVLVGTVMGGQMILSINDFSYEHMANDYETATTADTYTAFVDRERNIWFGGILGVSRLSSTKKSENIHLHEITEGRYDWPAVFLEAEDSIWIGYHGDGLRCLSKNSLAFGTIFLNDKNNPESISSNQVYDIVFSNDSRLWVGTDNGLNLHLGKGVFKRFGIEDGLPSGQILSLEADKSGNLWLGTNNGLCRFNTHDYSCTVFSIADGLQESSFRKNASCQDASGRMFFGGNNGVSIFHPDSLSSSSITGPMALMKVEVDNIPVDQHPSFGHISHTLLSDITLTHNEKIISFEFGMLNYTDPESNTYSYKLVGLDDDWHSIGNRRFISFSNLDPGNYQLQIKGANSSGVWSNDIIKINITVKPPYWRTIWFRTLMVLLFVAIVVAIYKVRVRLLKKQNKKLEDQVQTRTKEIEVQKLKVEEKNEEILDSINYAKRIQSAILPPKSILLKHFSDGFIWYQPKDVVAGDFYWMHYLPKSKDLDTEGDLLLIAAADCTGHGVPGAMVSVVCSGALDRSLQEFGIVDPGKLLDKTRELVLKTFETSDDDVKDGMDIALCSLSGNSLKYSGANNPLWIIRSEGKEIEEIKAAKQPIGKCDNPITYKTHTLEFNSGDSFYIFSDGFVDQFGGEKGKKFMSSSFKALLLSICHEPMELQKTLIAKAFEEWRRGGGSLEDQLDDVCVIGYRKP